MMKRLLLFAMLFCLATSAHAFDLPGLGLFCQASPPGSCSYTGQLTYNDPNGITTSAVSATATGNLAGNSGQIQGSMFTQWGGTCFYSLANDPGCTFLIYVFPPTSNGGCAPSGNIFHFCYQGPGKTCQETFNGGWNAQARMHTGAYIDMNMQSDLAVQLNVNGACPPNRPDILTLDLTSVPFSDCDGSLNGSGNPYPPFYCNEHFTVVPPSKANGNPITGNLNEQGDAE
jgi:hypothetical protein